MAKRPFFFIDDSLKFFGEENAEFQYFTGFAISQKKKSIESFHSEILNLKPHAKILEVSTKSDKPIGFRLSAFNLRYKMQDGSVVPLENVFQSSKVFENGGPFRQLLKCSPLEAKRYELLKTSGVLTNFELEGEKWPLVPKSMFYDFIYIRALSMESELCDDLMQYDTFTDIEFNPNKSINCQARAVAIGVSLLKKGLLDKYLSDKELFKSIYKEHLPAREPQQTSLF